MAPEHTQESTKISRLVRSVLVLSFSQVTSTAVSMLRNKLLAVILGPAGLGLFNQLQNLQNLAASAVPMGMQVGSTKYLARCRVAEPESLPRYFTTALRTFLTLAVVTTAASLLLVKPLARWAVDDVSLYLYLIPALLGVPFLIQTKVWQSYLQASLQMKEMSAAVVLTSIAGFLLAVPLVLKWHTAGAAVHLAIISIVGYLVMRVYAERSMAEELKAAVRETRFDREVLRNLVRFGVANIPGFALALVVPFLVRVQIISDLGLQANGIFQAAFAIAISQTAVVVTALGTYALPKLSQLTTSHDINDEVNRNLRVALLLNTPLILALLLLRDLSIHVLYSEKFLAAAVLFPWLLLAHFFKFITYALNAPILPMERFRARNIMCVAQYILYLGVFYAFPASGRLMGAAVAEAAGWGFELIAMFFYVRWLTGYRHTGENWLLLVKSAIAVVAVCCMPFPDAQWRLAGAGVMALWLVTALSRNERTRILAGISRARGS